MKPIRQLDAGLVNKIAAGEVVDRPLSVVKELAENSVDAGATSITVEISEGGLASVRITDNGSGIDRESLPLAFSRHATSKISSFDDLARVATMGFRGEALSSIAAVAQVELLTKTRMDSLGTRTVVHGGKHVLSEEVGAVDGTTVIVSNLFYNVPARRKFMKKPATEAGYVSQAVERLALGNAGLAIRYISEGSIVFSTGGANDLKTAIMKVYGREAHAKLVEIAGSEGGMRLSGYIAKPEAARGNRQHQSFFVNGRYVSSRMLAQAVESSVKSMFGVGKFPLFVLNLAIGHEDVDVNVHPNKTDVRFCDEEAVFSFVQAVVRDCFRAGDLVPALPVARPEKPARGMLKAGGGHAAKLPAGGHAKAAAAGGSASDSASDSAHDSAPDSAPDSVSGFVSAVVPGRVSERAGAYAGEKSGPEETEAREPMRALGRARILGQVFSTYWVAEHGDSMFLIDQHAAHERILYEKFMAKLRAGGVASQSLVEPVELGLKPYEKAALDGNREALMAFGFGLDGDRMTAVPALFGGVAGAAFFRELLDRLAETGAPRGSVYEHRTEAVCMAACKAAVKGGQRLCEAEARAIIAELLDMENPFTCPHGRPTVAEISRRDVEKRFGRVCSARGMP